MCSEPVVVLDQTVMGSKGEPDEIELSIVMACLNEVETVSSCVRKAVLGESIELCTIAHENVIAGWTR
jgi:hypothetical protein